MYMSVIHITYLILKIQSCVWVSSGEFAFVFHGFMLSTIAVSPSNLLQFHCPFGPSFHCPQSPTPPPELTQHSSGHACHHIQWINGWGSPLLRVQKVWSFPSHICLILPPQLTFRFFRCLLDVCVCVLYFQLNFFSEQKTTHSLPPKKNTRTNPHLQHGNVSKVTSHLFILQGIEAHSLPSSINTGPGGKTKKIPSSSDRFFSWKKQCRVLFFFFRLLFYTRNLTY